MCILDNARRRRAAGGGHSHDRWYFIKISAARSRKCLLPGPFKPAWRERRTGLFPWDQRGSPRGTSSAALMASLAVLGLMRLYKGWRRNIRDRAVPTSAAWAPTQGAPTQATGKRALASACAYLQQRSCFSPTADRLERVCLHEVTLSVHAAGIALLRSVGAAGCAVTRFCTRSFAVRLDLFIGGARFLRTTAQSGACVCHDVCTARCRELAHMPCTGRTSHASYVARRLHTAPFVACAWCSNYLHCLWGAPP